MDWLKDIIWDKLKGVIVVWSGALVDIPEGWHLCDGAEGTPDMRNRFIVGAGDEYNPGDVGGVNAHTHEFTSDGHQHALLPGAGIAAGTGFYPVTSINEDSGETEVSAPLPPYYALAYIMKL